MPLALDHLVIAAPTLDAGARHVADLLGVPVQPGGAHPGMGTHNRLLRLSGSVYLEVIAIDPEAPPPGRPRWFGLDSEAVQARLRNGPFLLHWAARVERPTDLSLWQSQYPARIAPAIPMTRGDLRWRITVPEDGSLPSWPAGDDGPAVAGDGVLPTLIQWDVPTHPCARLPDQGLALRALRGRHPQAARLGPAMQWLGGGLLALESADMAELSAEIETPDGVRTLR
ncbi:VOC family protein [Cupriavidus sp. 2TAF22]|uniref:VOC family protein n=1 Tax=unclassified Cupriavidus TaxID=2640874 RepID=UPI003F913AA7